MAQDIVVAIDGFSGVGKSSTAKEVARMLDYTYIDTGAMYRATTLYFLRHHVDITQLSEVSRALDQVHIQLKGGKQGYETFLNGQSVEEAIRGMEVSQHVSTVAALPVVRQAMVVQQRRMGQDKRIVMDGRDIGTHVFPQAELKIFMTADTQVRAQRRQQELSEKGQAIALTDVAENLTQRDQIDSTRQQNPLKKAPDAIEIDTTHLRFDEQVAQIIHLAQKTIQSP